MPLTSKSEWELVKDAKDNIIFYMAQVRVMNSKKVLTENWKVVIIIVCIAKSFAFCIARTAFTAP